MSDDEEEGEVPFETDSPFVNQIMDLIGWDAAMGVGVKDDLDTSSVGNVINPAYSFTCQHTHQGSFHYNFSYFKKG